MNACRRTSLLLVLAAAIVPTTAFADEAVTGCIDLGDDREILRPDGEHFLLRDGDSHYRVSFRRSCESMLITSRVDIVTQDQANRLCAVDTRIKTDRDTCRVASVETMTSEEFDRQKRRAKR